MKNTEFYAFCRDNRSTEPSLTRREAMYDVYNFMRECGTSKAGVKQFAERMIRESGGRHYDIEAYQWVLSVFESPGPTPEPASGQMKLF